MTLEKIISNHIEALRNIAKLHSKKSQQPLHVRKSTANQQMNGVIEVAKAFGIDEELYKWKDTFMHDYVLTNFAEKCAANPV